MPVVIGGWDSEENFLDAMARGEVPGVIPGNYVGPAAPNATVQPGFNLSPGAAASFEAIPTSSGFTVLPGIGFVPVASPGYMVNPILAGVWSGFDPNDIAGGLAIIKAYSLEVYGSVDLGTVRYSSEALENEPTGVRPGTMERIVIPAWARRERGSPL